MKGYFAQIQVEGNELNGILTQLESAINSIYDCYSRLEKLGFVSIKEAPPAATDGDRENG